MTNADCIRHMSDEQLYEFLSEWECGDIDYSVTFCDLCNEATKRGEIGNVLNLDCDGCRKHWLQRDAVEYGGLMYWKKNTTFQTETQNSNLTFEKEDEPNCSEKPNNCKPQTCVINPQEPTNDEKCFECDDFFTCGGQCNKIEDEPQTKCYLRTSCDHYGDKQVCGRCREYNLYSHTKDEPQTDCPWR